MCRAALLLSLLVALSGPLPASEPVPRGDVFDALYADPKELRSLASLLAADWDGYRTTAGLAGFSEQWGIRRWTGARRGEGFQLGITGGIFALFDMETESMDLINTDFVVGIPFTWRYGKTSARLRLYHQSSHLGDEFLLNRSPRRINLSYESLEGVLSYALPPFRLYAGSEWHLHHDPDDLRAWVFHGGIEGRVDTPFMDSNPRRRARWVTALDFKSTDERSRSVGWSGKTGFEFGPRDPEDLAARRWGLNATVYRGVMPYGQFFREKVTTFGLELQISR